MGKQYRREQLSPKEEFNKEVRDFIFALFTPYFKAGGIELVICPRKKGMADRFLFFREVAALIEDCLPLREQNVDVLVAINPPVKNSREILYICSLFAELEYDSGWSDSERYSKGNFHEVWSRIKDLIIQPTMVVDRGSLFQVYWVLEKPIAVTPEITRKVEETNEALATLIGGKKGSSSIRRFASLPGTFSDSGGKENYRIKRYGSIGPTYTLDQTRDVLGSLNGYSGDIMDGDYPDPIAV